MKRVISFFSVCMLLVSLSPLAAQSPYRRPWCAWSDYGLSLNLTSEQIKKFENLYKNFRTEIDPIQNSLTIKYLELRQLFGKSTTGKSSIMAKQKEISALQQKLQEKVMDYRLDALGILTTEQILLLPSDCCLGFNLGRGYGLGVGRGFARGRGRGYGLGFYRGRSIGWGRGRNSSFCPFWRR